MNKLYFSLILLSSAIIISTSCIFTVNQHELALRFNFNKIVEDTVYGPGLHFKFPLIDKVEKFDVRIQSLDSPPAKFLTSEKKNVMVDSFVKWRITNPAIYYTNIGNKVGINSRLDQIIKEGLFSEFAKHTIREVVSGKDHALTTTQRENEKIEEIASSTETEVSAGNKIESAENVKGDIRQAIMRKLTNNANQHALLKFGVEIIDVRIKRVDLPENISSSVYQRMMTERKRIARDIRSHGAESAEKIRAKADNKSIIIKATAFEKAEKIRGDGDREAANIYAKAYNQNPEFYAFYRSLSAYEKSFTGSDMMIVKPDSDFFRFFNSQGKDNQFTP